MSNSSTWQKLKENEIIRFVLSAGVGFLVDVSIFYLFYHNLLTQKTYNIFGMTVRNSSLSLAMSFFIGVMVNFLMTKYIVFTQSTLAPYKQFLRFCTVAVVGFFANLYVLKFFIQTLGFYPPIARPTAALSLFFCSFFIHKFFSFNLSLKKHAQQANH